MSSRGGSPDSVAAEARSYARNATFNLKAAQLSLQRARSLPAFTRVAAVNSAERLVRKCLFEDRAAKVSVSRQHHDLN